MADLISVEERERLEALADADQNRGAPSLADECACGHSLASHCTREFPNGGHCAVTDEARTVDGCNCQQFRWSDAFIAESRSAVPRLCAALAEAETEVERLRAHCDRLAAEGDDKQEEFEIGLALQRELRADNERLRFDLAVADPNHLHATIRDLRHALAEAETRIAELEAENAAHRLFVESVRDGLLRLIEAALLGEDK